MTAPRRYSVARIEERQVGRFAVRAGWAVEFDDGTVFLYTAPICSIFASLTEAKRAFPNCVFDPHDAPPPAPLVVDDNALPIADAVEAVRRAAESVAQRCA